MLFNSLVFVFAFLPITYVVFRGLTSGGRVKWASIWLALASLFFYGWFKASYVLIILVSLLFNFFMGKSVMAARTLSAKKAIMTFAVTANVGLLCYYKYTNFFLDNLRYFFDITAAPEIILPLGISFFTFQQIGFVADAYKGKVDEFDFSDYFLFVCFFPQFIAGPIVHHSEIMPQLKDGKYQRFNISDISVGLTMFAMGLFKKVILADGIAVFADPVFAASTSHGALSMIDSWGGAVAYTLQLYYDFSGYSDMAIGLGRMFGVRIPLNFNSPYRSKNISEFWRRWHITLSRFFRDYIYIPLGGNRAGKAKHYFNLMLVMTVCGIWHGADWSFVVMGVLHGIYLVTHNIWRSYLLKRERLAEICGSAPGRFLSWGISFVCVVVGWVFFRAVDVSSGYTVLKGMTGVNDLFAGGIPALQHSIFPMRAWIWVAGLLALEWALPSPGQYMRDQFDFEDPVLYDMPAYMRKVTWKPVVVTAVIFAVVFAYTVVNLQKTSVFLYFQF